MLFQIYFLGNNGFPELHPKLIFPPLLGKRSDHPTTSPSQNVTVTLDLFLPSDTIVLQET